MIIRLIPEFLAPRLVVVKSGDCLTINDVEYDFAPLPDGASLPSSAIDCPHIVGDVERIDGEIVLTLILPNTPESTEAVRFPEPMRVVTDGPVELPV